MTFSNVSRSCSSVMLGRPDIELEPVLLRTTTDDRLIWSILDRLQTIEYEQRSPARLRHAKTRRSSSGSVGRFLHALGRQFVGQLVVGDA
jgi:hypothetical protein